MTALQELVKFIEGDIRKGYVDYFLTLERKQITQAYEAGQNNGLNYNKGPLVSGKYYYEQKFGEDGKNDPLPKEFWTEGE
jgi:hypothetical protein